MLPLAEVREISEEILLEVLLKGYARIFPAEKRAGHVWQKEEQVQSTKAENTWHDCKEQVHKVVCRYETRKRNWGYVVCEGKEFAH